MYTLHVQLTEFREKEDYMLTLGIKKVNKFVDEQRKLGNDVRWDGWTLVFFRPSPLAIYNGKDGVYRNGEWGFDNRVEVNDKGLWEIEYRNVKHSRNSRN